ncbi:MAG: hypothetical protein WCQ95_11010 [Bacteroidota bacterium]
MKTTKILLLLTTFLLLVSGAFAQNIMQDVVYLKNGGIIRGTLIELVPDKHIKIQTVDGNVFVYQMSEIEKYVKEAVYHPQIIKVKDFTGMKLGYYGVVESGLGIGFGYDISILDSKLNIISGYRVNTWFAVGAGWGIRIRPGNEMYMPVFIDVRSNFLNKPTSPYISLDAGYGFCPSYHRLSGFMMSPTLGVSVKLKSNFAINLGLNYEMQHFDNAYSYYSYYRNASRYQHTISFQFGVCF